MRPKIYATGNEALKGEFNISYYILEKNESFLDWLSEILINILDMINGEERAKFFIKGRYTEDGEWIEDEFYIKDINKMIDLHESYKNNKDRIDIFYGKNRVYVTLRGSNETRKKFVDFIRKTKDWIKIKEVQEIPAYVKKQKIKSTNYFE